MILIRARLLIASLWVGSLWAIGYLAAPTLFATLADRVLAGTVAGSLFRSESWLSLACGIILLTMQIVLRRRTAVQQRSVTVLAAAMIVCTLTGYFVLQPFMAALREAAGPAGLMAGEARQQFAMLHGVSMLIYLIESLLGIGLLLKLQNLKD